MFPVTSQKNLIISVLQKQLWKLGLLQIIKIYEFSQTDHAITFEIKINVFFRKRFY